MCEIQRLTVERERGEREMRDACFKDMLMVIKNAHEDTPSDVGGKEALLILYDAVASEGPNGFGPTSPHTPGGGPAMTDKCQHTPCPEGYLHWHSWAARMAKTHRQIKCSHCGLWAIWVPKVPRKFLKELETELTRLADQIEDRA